jgi:hypothetical protein
MGAEYSLGWEPTSLNQSQSSTNIAADTRDFNQHAQGGIAMATVTTNTPKFVSACYAARVWGVGQGTVAKIARTGHVATQKLPGLPVRYSLDDVQRVAREAITAPERELAAAQ